MTDFKAARTAMVDTQVRPSDVTKFPIIEALLETPKEEFVPSARKSVAYADAPIPLAKNRTILDARTMGKMLDAANIQPTELVLDIGCGYGYSTALISRLAEAVVAVEDIEDAARDAEAMLTQHGADNAVVIQGSLTEGAAKYGPFCVVMIQGTVAEVPATLTSQIRDGGRIVSLVQQDGISRCCVGSVSGGNISWKYAFDAGASILPGFEKPQPFGLS